MTDLPPLPLVEVGVPPAHPLVENAASAAPNQAAAPAETRDTLHLVVGGRRYTGWVSVRVSCSLERVPASFEIALTERYPGEAAQIDVSAGDPCQILIGTDLVLTGYVDRRMPAIGPEGNLVRIMGRSRSQDLVDCDVDPDSVPNMQISSGTASSIATQLAQTYGVTVKVLNAGNGRFVPQLNINLGEKVFPVIEQCARYSALLLYDDPDGSLVLATLGTASMASGFQEGVNIERANGQEAMDQRFSDYAVYVNSSFALQDIGPIQPAALVHDTTVPRHRKMCVVSEQAMLGLDIATQRGKWELARRFGRSQPVSLTADSWRDSAGKLWQINTLVPIDAPHLKVVGKTWLIVQVDFRRDASGTHADLVLMPKEGFQPEPTILTPFDLEIYQAHRGAGGAAAP